MTEHWLNRERLKLYPAAFLTIYIAFAALLLVKYPSGADDRGNALMPDFIVFWSASHIALTGEPVDAYDFASIAKAERIAMPVLKGQARWLYPPTFYLLLLPLALLPYFYSYLLFSGTTLAAYVVVVRRICASQGLTDAVGWWPLLGFPAVFLNVYKGQNGLLTAALMGTALLLLRSRPVLAGALIGLLTIKPHLGLLLPVVLICGRHWRALFSATLTALAFTALSLAVLGADTLGAFFSSVREFAPWAAGDVLLQRENPTFFAFFHLLGLSSTASVAFHGVVAVAVAWAVAWIWLRCVDFSLRAAALTAGTMLVSPYLLDYDLAWLALAIAWFSGYAMRNGWLAWERELLVLAWLLPALTFLIHHVLPLQLDPFVLLALFLMIWRRSCRDVAWLRRNEAGLSAGVQSVSPKRGDSTEAST